MSDLIDTTEMYLKAIWELVEDGVPPLRARLAERLDQSGPTVSQTVARMERDGLIVLREDRMIEFTTLGGVYATRVMRKHRLSELLLLEVLGLDIAYVHDEACRWEHVVGREVEERIVRIVADPRWDPYGNPVPGLGELGLESAGGSRGRALAEAGPGEAAVVRIGEPLQAEVEVLRRLWDAGVRPGACVVIESGGGAWRVGPAPAGPAVELGPGDARHLFVDA